MTSAVFDTDVYAVATQAHVLGEAPALAEPVRPHHARIEVWMSQRAVQASVAIAAAAFVGVTLTVVESQAVVDRFAVRAETSVDDDTPAWITNVVKRMKGYLSLESGWDSYEAPPVTDAAVTSILAAIESLAKSDTPAPSIGPTPEGGIQVEWHERGIDLELRSDSGGFLYAFFQHRDMEAPTWDGELPDPSIAAPWFERLTV